MSEQEEDASSGAKEPKSAAAKLLAMVRDHLFKAIIGVAGTVAVAFFQWEYKQLKDHLAYVQCEFTEYTVEAGLDDVQSSLAAITLNDLDQNSPVVRRLRALVGRAKGAPQECKSEVLKAVGPASSALRAYIDRRYEEVAEELKALDPPKPAWEGLFYQLRGSSEFQLGIRTEGKERDKYMEKAKTDLKRHEDIVLSWGGAQGLRMQLLASCRPHIGQITKEANEEAIKCLSRMKEFGVADYNTYLNLAAKHARLGQEELALRSLQICIDLGGYHKVMQDDILRGGPFDRIRQGPNGARFEKMLKKFKQ